MTARFINSAPVERAFQTRKQWQHPGRRRHIYGELRPMHEQRDPTARYFIALAIVVASIFAAQLGRIFL
jgi:hypothetical protein